MGCIPSKTKVTPEDEHRAKASKDAKERRKKQHIFENLVKEEFLVDIERDYNIDDGRILGSGVSGSVRVCRDKNTGKEFALKTLLKNTMRTENLLALKNEIRIMATTNHPNIIRLYSTYETDTCIYLVTELATGGEVLDHLQQQKDYHYGEDQARAITRQMVNAVRYLHERNIVHRDLKLENFLFVNSSPESPLKMIDFGLSEFATQDEILHAKVGTCYYVAPEVLAGQYNASCDCWALGVIAYMLLCGYPPFNGANDREILHRVKKGTFHFSHEPFKRVSDEAKDFISRLLVMDSDNRMTMAEAQMHPWMTMNLGHEEEEEEQTEEEVTFSRQVIRNLANFSTKKKLQKIAMEVVAYSIGSTDYSPMVNKQSGLSVASSTSKTDGSNSGKKPRRRKASMRRGDMIDKLRREFERIDTDGTGEIDFLELKGAMENTNVREEELMRIFDHLDVDNSGTINFTEFLAAAIPEEEIDEEHIRWAFDRLSGEHGMISKEELVEVLGVDMTEEEIEHMIDEALTAHEQKLRGDGNSSHGAFHTPVRHGHGHGHGNHPPSLNTSDQTSSTPTISENGDNHPRVLTITTRNFSNEPVKKTIDYDTFVSLIMSVPESVNSPYFKAMRSGKLNTPGK